MKTHIETYRFAIHALCLSLLVGYTLLSQAGETDYQEKDIDTLQALMTGDKLSAVKLVQFYLNRINEIDRNGTQDKRPTRPAEGTYSTS